jgi:hypothetical protein
MVATATMKRNGAATFGATIATAGTALFSRFATFLRYGIAALPIYPAARINWDAGIVQHDETGAIAGIGIAVIGAICMEGARHAQSRSGAAGWRVIGLILLAISYSNGLSNFATNSDHSRDLKSSQQTASATLSLQRSQLVDRRNAQVAIVAKQLQSVRGVQLTFTGEEAAESIEAEIEETKAAKAGFWRASDGCKAEKLHSPEAKAYCQEIADLGGKKAAAKKRDEIDGDLREFDNKHGNAEAPPSSVDSFADSVADFIVLLGYKFEDKDGKDTTAKAKLLISKIRDWGRALGVEIMAFVGPSIILYLFGLADAPKKAEAPQPQPQPQRTPEKAPKAKVAPIVAETPENAPATIPAIVATSQKDDPEIDGFYNSRLEDAQGVNVDTTPVWEAWKQYCAERGINPGSRKAFCGRMQRYGVGYDPNNKRSIYLNVRLTPAESRSQGRAEHGGLRLAVNNA